MAKETFSVIAMEETSYWFGGEGELARQTGCIAAFSYQLIRHGERTHICSLTPNSYCVFIKNEFVYDSDNEAAHEWAGENMYENGGGNGGDYFGYIDVESMDPRFIADTFTIEVEDDLDADGRETDAYHDAIWEQAEEAARDLDCNGLFADICNSSTYAQYQREQQLKRQAENRPVCAGNGEHTLPLFVAAAKREGFWNWEGLREHGWI